MGRQMIAHHRHRDQAHIRWTIIYRLSTVKWRLVSIAYARLINYRVIIKIYWCIHEVSYCHKENF